MWYDETSPEFWEGQEFAFKVIRDEAPPESEEYPLFVWDAAQTGGWYGIESLIETVKKYPPQLSGNSGQFEGRRDRESKREHDVPMGTVNQADILPLLIGDGITLTRSGPDVTVPLGGKVALVIPSGMQVSASHSGDETILSIDEGNPVIRLPWIGRLWPIKVDGMRLSGDTLTVELDGWKDYQIKVLP